MNGGTHGPGRSPVNRLVVAAGLLLAASLAGCSGDPDGSGAPRPATSAALSLPGGEASDGTHVPIEPGTYLVPRSAWSVAGFRVAFPEGWTVQYGHAFSRFADGPHELGFYAVVVDEVFADTCRGEGTTKAVGPRVEDLVAALLRQPGGAAVSRPVPTTLGGYPATRLDLRIPAGVDLTVCRLAKDQVAGLQVWYSEPADKYFVLLPGETATVYVVDVDGQRQVFLAQLSEPRSDADRAELQTVLDSIRIEASTA